MIRSATLNDPYDVIIALCWLTVGIVWVTSAMFVKRTTERPYAGSQLLLFVAVMVVFSAAKQLAFVRQELWPRTQAVGAVAALLTIAGASFAIWARAILGSNWSGTITLKEGHELIERGPYHYVRHPIYSGLLLMGLGSAISFTRVEGFVLLGLVLGMFAVSAHFEERLMLRHFPDAYPSYRKRTKALLPGVW